MNIELLIRAQKVYQPIVLDEITLEQERKGAPSKLEFTVVKDQNIAFEHGNQVQLKIDGTPMFMGFVFEKSRDKKQHIKVVAYDQLRYLKNKDTYVYKNATASDLIKRIANDFKLKLGTIENTGYKIKRSEDNQTLFDIIQNALYITGYHTGKIFVLYDDFGKLTLKNVESMKTNILIDAETAEDFDYSSSIDGDTFNQIKLVKENDKTKKREIYIVKDNNRIGDWGVLQYYDTIQEEENGKSKANWLLRAKNRVVRNITIKGCFGDLSVRAGSSVPVNLNIGDKIIDNKYLVVERVKHKFTTDHHSMDLTLFGGNLFEV